MALSSCFCNFHVTSKIDYPRCASTPEHNNNMEQISNYALKPFSTESISQRVTQSSAKPGNIWSFIGGSKLNLRPVLPKQELLLNTRRRGVCASWWMMSEIASNAFTLATAAVLPFYTLMVVAPKAELTRKSMKSSIPYAALGITYAYLLYLSWTPETLHYMFASKYWLPELPGIARLFSNEMTLASVWIHLMAVDLFAARSLSRPLFSASYFEPVGLIVVLNVDSFRQVFQDGLENKIETRHSVSLCLLCCPIGIFTHFITKALAKSRRN